MANNIVPLRTKSQKTTSTSTDTISFRLADVERWLIPSFQRPLNRNHKFRDCVALIRDSDGVIPGAITLGVLTGSGDVYRIDGNHRLEAWKESGCETGYADVRYVHGSMDDFADEFLRLNTPIAAFKPDDRLRPAAVSNPRINRLIALCKVVGYSPQKNQPKIKVSMSSVLRAWNNASRGTPAARGKAASAVDIISDMTDEDFNNLVRVLNHCESAWGRDREYATLWSQMNLTTVMWLYDKMVANDPPSPKLRRMSGELFEKCLMALSANYKYADWLRGRNGGTHRGPCYMRVKEMFAARMKAETGSKPNLPQPDWASR